jgi:hypothetical protein
MTRELREGLRTLVVQNGQEFELPAGHTVRLYEGQGTHVVLGVPGGGASLLTVAEIQERGDAIVIRLDDEIGRVANLVAGDVVPEVSGYPFPADGRLGRMVDLDADGNAA